MSDLKYGRLKDDYSKQKVDLTLALVKGDFSMVPSTQENLTPELKSQLQMLGNDAAGDCEAVRWANHRLLVSGNYPMVDGKTTQDLVWEAYQTQNPDFDPNGDPSVNGPGSSSDRGMSSDIFLDHLRTVGGPDGVKVLMYATIDHNNIQAVEQAIALFGAVWVDILVQPGNQQEFAQKVPWTNTGETPEGGHAVLGSGYIPQRRIITWADETTLADDFWSGVTPDGSLVEKVYIVVWPENATHEFIQSAGADLLAEDFRALTGLDFSWPTQS